MAILGAGMLDWLTLLAHFGVKDKGIKQSKLFHTVHYIKLPCFYVVEFLFFLKNCIIGRVLIRLCCKRVVMCDMRFLLHW